MNFSIDGSCLLIGRSTSSHSPADERLKCPLRCWLSSHRISIRRNFWTQHSCAEFKPKSLLGKLATKNSVKFSAESQRNERSSATTALHTLLSISSMAH